MGNSLEQHQKVAKPKITKYAIWGELTVSLALIIFLILAIFLISQVLMLSPLIIQEKIDIYTIEMIFDTLTNLQASLLLFVWGMPNLIVIIILLIVRKLFKGYRKLGVFINIQAKRQKMLGWLLMSIGPIGVLSQTLSTFMLSVWMAADQTILKISVNDVHIYTFVIGFVMLLIGHITLEAVSLAEENDSFI